MVLLIPGLNQKYRQWKQTLGIAGQAFQLAKRLNPLGEKLNDFCEEHTYLKTHLDTLLKNKLICAREKIFSPPVVAGSAGMRPDIYKVYVLNARGRMLVEVLASTA